MKAIELLKDYKNIDFGCNVEELHNEIDEAIKELEALTNENKSLVKTLGKYNEEMLDLRKENQELKNNIDILLMYRHLACTYLNIVKCQCGILKVKGYLCPNVNCTEE